MAIRVPLFMCTIKTINKFTIFTNSLPVVIVELKLNNIDSYRLRNITTYK